MMSNNNWIEIPVFIHGITPEENPGSHDLQYDILYANIQAALKVHNKPTFKVPPIKIEWGWRNPNSARMVEQDQYLADVERAVARQALAVEANIWDFTLNPARLVHKELRKAFLFGFADLLYYASKDGEATVRRHVFKDIVTGVNQYITESQKKISLTIVGHSAGSLIAHDLLYHLFGKDKISDFPEVRELRKLADGEQPRLRVRRFYTIGSPITPLTFRSNALIKKNLTNSQLNPNDIGLRFDNTLSNPRWLNIWDKDDIASFPVSFLYENTAGVVKDQYVDLGDVFPPVHNIYWTNAQVAKQIAETF